MAVSIVTPAVAWVKPKLWGTIRAWNEAVSTSSDGCATRYSRIQWSLTAGRWIALPAVRSLQPVPPTLPFPLRRSAAFTPHVPAGSRFVRPVLEYCRPVGSRCRHRRDRTPRCLHRHGRAVHQPPRRRPIILRQPEEDGFARYAPWGPRPISILEPLTNRTESNKNSMCGVFGQATA